MSANLRSLAFLLWDKAELSQVSGVMLLLVIRFSDRACHSKVVVRFGRPRFKHFMVEIIQQTHPSKFDFLGLNIVKLMREEALCLQLLMPLHHQLKSLI